MSTNDFVPFCNENTGTNLPTQSAYLANPALPIGNQPGIASSSLNNKAIRQGSTIAAVIAQVVSDQMSVSMLDNQNTADHAIPPALYAAANGLMKRLSPIVTVYTSGTAFTHKITYKFFVSSANATVGATYSDGTTTYTIAATITGGTELKATGAASPVATAGTLTKSGGTGDATITYYAYRIPLWIRVTGAGGGGGGGGAASAASSSASGGGGGAGGYFQKIITGITAGYLPTITVGAAGNAGAAGANSGGSGGATTYSDGTVTLTGNGGNGGNGGTTANTPNPGGGGNQGGTATGGDINVKGGSGGTGSIYSGTAAVSGAGGANPLSSLVSGVVGTGAGNAGLIYGGGGAGGAQINNAGTQAGGAGAAGVLILEEHYQ